MSILRRNDVDLIDILMALVMILVVVKVILG